MKTIIGAGLLACLVALSASAHAATPGRVMSGKWEVITFAGGCRAVLFANGEFEQGWGPDPSARFTWSGACNADRLIAGNGTLITTFTSKEGNVHARDENRGVTAVDGILDGRSEQGFFSDFDDEEGKVTPMTQRHFGDLPNNYVGGCNHFANTDGTIQEYPRDSECKPAEGAAVRDGLRIRR